MILRNLERNHVEPAQAGFRPAWKAFADTQQMMEPRYAIILQPEHSCLAGDIAANLNPDIFGDLSDEVVQTIREHDSGWKDHDERGLAEGIHIPFPLLKPDQYIPLWEECVKRAMVRSSQSGCLTSRHFCAVADNHPAHQQFVLSETTRREEAERLLKMSPEDIDRFTAALGFCDLLSLLLCSGVTERAAFPLAHPALPDAHKANKVLLDWRDGNPRFSRPVVLEDTTVSIFVREQTSTGLQPLRLSWTFLA